ncbi:stretch-activated cation channel Mid1 [Roridomyces roridus]|uniref:Stretch-activated cation channel Mid1 n=1 Tax=Roridomyces roridus TaxID=1738132 RepID=A0AAD7G058_9AGAR|nr:stretch-activated cation channel Mid1 [Roridomyces roridus]
MLFLLLLHVARAAAQNRPLLTLDNVYSQSAPSPPFFTLPSASQLAISVALCSGNLDTAVPRFFVTNSSSTASPGSGGGDDVFEIILSQGQGSWTGVFPSGGVVGVEGAGQMPFEIGVSQDGPLHEILDTQPLVGDSTGTAALLFSPAYSAPTTGIPAYPNYSLPAAIPSLPAPPAPTNCTLVVSPTSNSLTSMPQTACMLTSLKSSGTIVNESLWLRDHEGWRTEWLLTGLTAKTNYTMYAIQEQHKVAGPIFFTTKSSSFSCPLVSRLPYCPMIAYAMPLPPPPSPQVVYDSTNLPAGISDPVTEVLTNFTTVLNTFACGRDFYSPIVTCQDCQSTYRTWLCAISFPRCADPDTAPAAAALLPSQAPNMRNSAFPPGNNYTQLLPCLEACTATDRACPNFLGFKCPLPRFNAAQSYGVGYIDSGVDGEQGGGSTGAWSDNYGNVWCNW